MTSGIRILSRFRFISLPSSAQESVPVQWFKSYKTARTELESQTCRLLAGPWQHLGLDLHSIGARIGRNKREEQSGGLGAQREGVEGDADVGEESSDHAEEVVVGRTAGRCGRNGLWLKKFTVRSLSHGPCPTVMDPWPHHLRDSRHELMRSSCMR
jgi:hypothetical protein